MTSEETRIKALAQFLELEPDDIEPAEYTEGGFTVLPRPAKRGTSPQEAKEIIIYLREVLERVIGPETKAWTTDTFYREYAEHQQAKTRVEELERELVSLQRDLPSIKSPYHVCSKCDHIKWEGPAGKCAKCKAPMIKLGDRRKVRMLDVTKMSPQLKTKTLPALKLIEQHRQKLQHERDEVLTKFTYNNIITLIQIKQPEALSVGVHQVANALHFLMPQQSYNHAQEHRKTLGEAFDGKEIKDRRESYTADSGSYLVLNDDEADKLWNEQLDSYLDECVLPELPEQAQQYFDRDSWKEDARGDGRGHAISGYDGEEREIMVDDEWLYIYRTN